MNPNEKELKDAGILIRERTRTTASPKPGMRSQWTEYQVVNGRKIVSRHDMFKHALRAAQALVASEIQ